MACFGFLSSLECGGQAKGLGVFRPLAAPQQNHRRHQKCASQCHGCRKLFAQQQCRKERGQKRLDH